ncbi:helix-turn-helix domain-containing protein [Ochrovirga pacifica]|uniref:helix-turn-helix domain-containing protein n=1 Tax=Ochrovirga pacifica TaxID=1042376 RepID=UPI000255922A|nr:helix-turn-helix domain-containing protein [Ochrovirga pacifica]
MSSTVKTEKLLPLKSIAVLPFVNMSSNSENSYFCDGMTEEIINALTTIANLKVIARTSSFAYKNKNTDLRTVGQELGVVSILEGSIRFQKKRVRITAQLINTTDGFHYWSQNFDRELQDIFQLQDEISLLIADKIRENFGHLDLEDSLVKPPDISITAYQHFLQAKALIAEFNKQAILQGIDLLKNIINDFPNFAQAYVTIHYAYNSMAAGGLMPVEKAFDLGGTYLNKANDLDMYLPEVYHSKGWDALNKNWDFIHAVQHLQKAIQLLPNYADAHQKLFITLILEGNLSQAQTHIQHAYELDPLNDLNNYFMAYNAYINSDAQNTNVYFNRCFEINNKFIVGYSIYALALIHQKRSKHILRLCEQIPPIEGSDIEIKIMQTLAYAAMQHQSKLQVHLDQLQLLLSSDSRERVRFFLIYVYVLLKEDRLALQLIDQGIENKEPLMTLLKVDPLLKPLHRYQKFNQQLQTIFKLSNTHILSEKTTVKKPLSSSLIATYKNKLQTSMEQDQVYLDSSLSLRKLAQKIDLHPNQLSWLLNDCFDQNFNDFINFYRIQHFKKLAVQPGSEQYTLLSLAYESGFNSKSVFNACFKKQEANTPSQWVKSVKKPSNFLTT